ADIRRCELLQNRDFGAKLIKGGKDSPEAKLLDQLQRRSLGMPVDSEETGAVQPDDPVNEAPQEYDLSKIRDFNTNQRVNIDEPSKAFLTKEILPEASRDQPEEGSSCRIRRESLSSGKLYGATGNLWLYS